MKCNSLRTGSGSQKPKLSLLGSESWIALMLAVLESLIRNQSSSGENEAEPVRYLAFSQCRYSWLAFSTYLRASSEVRRDTSFSESPEINVRNSGAGSGSFILHLGTSSSRELSMSMKCQLMSN